MLHVLYKPLSSTIDPQSIARHMFQCNALTLKELQTIQSKENKPMKAAEKLLNIVMNKSSNVYGSFLDALKKTGHQHVFEDIVSDSCKAKHDTVALIVSEIRGGPKCTLGVLRPLQAPWRKRCHCHTRHKYLTLPKRL